MSESVACLGKAEYRCAISKDVCGRVWLLSAEPEVFKNNQVADEIPNVSLIDKHAFESRSRTGCSNSDYHLCRTDCCEHFGVEDDELLDFYFDARDPSKHVFMEKGVGCPVCGAMAFSYHKVEESAEMPEEWRWAAARDLPEQT